MKTREIRQLQNTKEASQLLVKSKPSLSNMAEISERPLMMMRDGTIREFIKVKNQLYFRDWNASDYQPVDTGWVKTGSTVSLSDTGDSVRFGNDTNYADITSGVISYAGTSKRKLYIMPQVESGLVARYNKPTGVSIGAFNGFSLPIYSADNEEIFFKANIDGRWDGGSDITFEILTCLNSAETAGEDFRIQLSWARQAKTTGVISSSTTDVETQQELQAGRAAQYDMYLLTFTIDWDTLNPDIVAKDVWAGRLRRIAATGGGADEVDGEVIVLDWVLSYTTDKVFAAS